MHVSYFTIVRVRLHACERFVHMYTCGWARGSVLQIHPYTWVVKDLDIKKKAHAKNCENKHAQQQKECNGPHVVESFQKKLEQSVKRGEKPCGFSKT